MASRATRAAAVAWAFSRCPADAQTSWFKGHSAASVTEAAENLLTAGSASSAAATAEHWLTGDSPSACSPETLSKYPSGWPEELDVGIYWFGLNDQFEKAGALDAEGRPKASKFYDPSKHTVIYFHGWTGGHGGWVSKCYRTTTRCPENVCPESERTTFLADTWINASWNVGYFYWDQFSDEECARDAEQKIWFDRAGDGLRWKSFNPNTMAEPIVKDYYEKSISVADLCVESVKKALGDYVGSHVRFVGHSIGTQLATRCAAKLHTERHRAAPQRIGLLEPYFTKHHLSIFRCSNLNPSYGIGTFTAEATASYIKNLWQTKQVVTEMYKSSVLTENELLGETDRQLERLATLVIYKPQWCGPIADKIAEMIVQDGSIYIECHHLAVFPLYFLSFSLPAPKLEPEPRGIGMATPGSALLECSTPASRCSDFQLWEWEERQHKVKGAQTWTQLAGQSTFDLRDDTFTISPTLGDVQDTLIVEKDSDDRYVLHRDKRKEEATIGGSTILIVLCLGCLGAYLYRKATTQKRHYGRQEDDPEDLTAVVGE